MPTQELALTQQEPSVPMMLQKMIESGITADNVSAMEKMLELHERMQQRQAEREFNAAFAAVQSEMPDMQATAVVPDKQGNVKFKFAPYEEIMGKVKPLLTKHGFAVAFDSTFRDGRIFVTCTLMHAAGHSKTNTFSTRIGSGPPGASECQADGAASTYAKRFALCNALNIVIDKEHPRPEDDVRNVEGPINREEAIELREWVDALGSDRTKFLEMADAGSFEEISRSKLVVLQNVLKAKEKAKEARK